MPIYQYQCDSCGLRFEQGQRFADQPLSECPRCNGRVRRVIQPVGVVFRGSGFYVTDNRQVSSPTLRPTKEADKPSEAKPAAGEETKPQPAASEETAS